MTLEYYCSVLPVYWCGCLFEEQPEYYLDSAGNLNGSDFSACDPSGCVDPEACNFDECAVFDDATCCYGQCIEITITDSFGDGGGSLDVFDQDEQLVTSLSLEDGFEITEDFCLPEGCLDMSVYSDPFPNNVGIIVSNSDGIIYQEFPGDGITASVLLDTECACTAQGCLDENAINFDSMAQADCSCLFNGEDFSCCEYAGCTDSNACNFDSTVVGDDGSCAYPGDECFDSDWTTIDDQLNENCNCIGFSPGCTDSSACNFDELAEADDGTCYYIFDPCDDGNELTINDQLDSNCQCNGEGPGCSDNSAVNFNEFATSDDGSCCYDYYIQVHIEDTFGDGGGSFTIFDLSLNELSTGQSDDFEYWSEPICFTNPECLSITITPDAFPDEISLELIINNEVVYFHETGQIFESYIIHFFSDPESECEFAGCLDPDAYNYDSAAIYSDGYCIYTSLGDYNADGEYTSNDLTMFLSEFGNPGEGLLGDFDQNGFVGAADLTQFLSVFGLSVP